jgi:hypothetical protein
VTRRTDEPMAILMTPGGLFDAGTAVPGRRPLAREPHAPRAERQPDEIQIHIGRIEVTAVSAPAPRPPRPPDKSVSLDDYLRRRGGRAK